MISGDAVMKLREATGAGVMECKKALTEANGDFDAALKIIGERGLAKAAGKSERATGTGYISTYVHADRVGVMLELRCETDFVARSDKFKELAKEIMMHVAAMNPADVAELLAQPFVKDPTNTVEYMIQQTVAVLGENIKVERFIRFEV
jgi:elongation factor Ts